MPDTRPGTPFNEQGVCQACLNFDKRKKTDWKKRKEDLKEFCDQNRRNDGYYDCIITVSGGKDSHMQVHTLKNEYGMNPLLVTVSDPFTKSRAGEQNLKNLSETFNCDHLMYTISTSLFRKVTRIAFEDFGEPLRYVETAICTVPYKLAINLGIPWVVYGESEFEYGSWKEGAMTTEFILNRFKKIDLNFWLKKGFSLKELNAIIPPPEKDQGKANVIVMSYFIPWSSTRNLAVAKRYGFHDVYHEWRREGFIEDFEQIDSLAYIIHLWLKYPKFGFQRTSDIASRRVREGKLTLDEAKKLIMENDYKIDQRALDDFCNFCGYSIKEFWDIVEKYWNRNIFEKVDGIWQPKPNFYEDF